MLCLLCLCLLGSHSTIPGMGEQPHIGRDGKGVIRVVYGQKDKIYCTGSTDNGKSFSTPVLVAELSGMHLGMSRGPQVASSAHYSVIAAMDKTGNIHWFRLENSGGAWKDMGMVNDVRGSAPEGLMGLAADDRDNFYAVWLDIRTGKQNEIYFSSLAGGSKAWAPNRLLYRSPDGHVCECCKPNVYAEGTEVAVMFRNWLGGSRDLYVIRSHNKGRSFEQAQKLGEGTWKLNGCPMDGGGVTIDPTGGVHTVWQREGNVYYCRPGEKERLLGKGRICSIAGSGAPVISMQTGDTVKLIRPLQGNTTVIGTGSFLQSLPLPDNSVLCVWERDGVINFKKE